MADALPAQIYQRLKDLASAGESGRVELDLKDGRYLGVRLMKSERMPQCPPVDHNPRT